MYLLIYNLNQYYYAIECYDQVIKINPSHSDAIKHKGLTLQNISCYQDAIVCYGQAIQLDPNHPVLFNNKGFCLLSINSYQNAIEWFNQAIKLDGNYSAALKNKGVALYNLNRYQDAIQNYDQAIKIDDKDSFIYKNKALLKLNWNQDAIKCSDQASKQILKTLMQQNIRTCIKIQPVLKMLMNECYDQAVLLNLYDSFLLNNKGHFNTSIIQDLLSLFQFHLYPNIQFETLLG